MSSFNNYDIFINNPTFMLFPGGELNNDFDKN